MAATTRLRKSGSLLQSEHTSPVRKRDNLYTCSLVALDADTGALRWYFQFTPHDTHDWDAAHVPRRSLPGLGTIEPVEASKKTILRASRLLRNKDLGVD
jgi:hypothetical protein